MNQADITGIMNKTLQLTSRLFDGVAKFIELDLHYGLNTMLGFEPLPDSLHCIL